MMGYLHVDVADGKMNVELRETLITPCNEREQGTSEREQYEQRHVRTHKFGTKDSYTVSTCVMDKEPCFCAACEEVRTSTKTKV